MTTSTNTVTDRSYAIEMFEGQGASENKKYGVVHVEGCSHLRDPEPLGTDWKAGVAALGTDWEMDLADDMIRLAPCAQ